MECFDDVMKIDFVHLSSEQDLVETALETGDGAVDVADCSVVTDDFLEV